MTGDWGLVKSNRSRVTSPCFPVPQFPVPPLQHERNLTMKTLNFSKMAACLSAPLIAAVSTLAAVPAEAIEFKVYSYMTPERGEAEVAYWFTDIVRSDNGYEYFGEVLDKEGLMRHSFEIEYGLTDHWTVAAYGDFEKPKDGDFKYVQTRAVVTRYRFFEKGDHIVDGAIYVEYYLPYHKYSDEEKLEAKVILEKTLGPVTVTANPIFEKAISSDKVDEGVEFEYGARLALHPAGWLRTGVEFYGEMGELGDLAPVDEQEHYVFPAIEVELPFELALDVGYGFGLTKASDDQIVKAILEMELE